MSVAEVLVVMWALGWVGATIFAAAVIGDLDDGSPPAFFWPLFFGWSWPACIALALIIAPLSWLSERTNKRNALNASDDKEGK